MVGARQSAITLVKTNGFVTDCLARPMVVYGQLNRARRRRDKVQCLANIIRRRLAPTGLFPLPLRHTAHHKALCAFHEIFGLEELALCPAFQH